MRKCQPAVLQELPVNGCCVFFSVANVETDALRQGIPGGLGA